MSSFNLSLFDFSGFAARTDVEKEGWSVLFDRLKKKQTDFLKYEGEFRSNNYQWPRDPLHTWSRLWEYPYVYHHIKKIRDQKIGEKLQITDFGSGVTFFPFAVAQLGCDVICADIDPVVAVDIPVAAKSVQFTPGTIDGKLIENGRIPVEPESQDIVYCVSVIEHIPNFASVIDEMVRVLKPDGQLILTVDIDLQGNYELGIDEFEHLQSILDVHFTKKLTERAVHPSNMLTTMNSPYCMRKWSPYYALERLLKGCLRGKLVLVGPTDLLILAVYAGIFVKR